ncbi:uncharacterized protein J3R85_011565 [Psidium guajava]|nr:uncharacterized protein J3R85_011565 [Psidium guajava]
MGHYAQNCTVIPYLEEAFADNENLFYGSWLRSEMNLNSPFWQSYYEADLEGLMEEETIPETLENSDRPDLP